MNKEFTHQNLNDAGVAKAAKIRAAFDALLEGLAPSDNRLVGLCPPGREMSIVRTKLEEACMFAVKAMANEEGNQLVRDKNKPT